jgi:hypothetical protein
MFLEDSKVGSFEVYDFFCVNRSVDGDDRFSVTRNIEVTGEDCSGPFTTGCFSFKCGQRCASEATSVAG